VQDRAIQEVTRLERLDDSLPGPIQLGIEPQCFPEVIERLAVVSLVQQCPALIGMRKCILWVTRQRPSNRGTGILASAHLHQRHGTQVRAPHVLRINRKSLLGCRKCILPATLMEPHTGKDTAIIGIARVEPNGFLNRSLSVIDPITVERDASQSVMTERRVGLQVDCLFRLVTRFLKPFALHQTESKQRMRRGIVGICPELLPQLLLGKLVPRLLDQYQSPIEMYAHRSQFVPTVEKNRRFSDRRSVVAITLSTQGGLKAAGSMFPSPHAV
jgi:hypothetical protein